MTLVATGGNGYHHDKTRNFITANFALHFRQMYYNPKKKEISFYVSPQDSTFVYRGQEEREFLDVALRNHTSTK